MTWQLGEEGGEDARLGELWFLSSALISRFAPISHLSSHIPLCSSLPLSYPISHIPLLPSLFISLLPSPLSSSILLFSCSYIPLIVLLSPSLLYNTFYLHSPFSPSHLLHGGLSPASPADSAEPPAPISNTFFSTQHIPPHNMHIILNLILCKHPTVSEPQHSQHLHFQSCRPSPWPPLQPATPPSAIPAAALNLEFNAIASTLLVGVPGISIPLIGKYRRLLRTDSSHFVIAKAFAAGVILAMGFVHILPSGSAALNSPCLPEFPWSKFSFSEFFAMMASLATLVVDFVGMQYYERKQGLARPGPERPRFESGQMNRVSRRKGVGC